MHLLSCTGWLSGLFSWAQINREARLKTETSHSPAQAVSPSPGHHHITWCTCARVPRGVPTRPPDSDKEAGTCSGQPPPDTQTFLSHSSKATPFPGGKARRCCVQTWGRAPQKPCGVQWYPGVSVSIRSPQHFSKTVGASLSAAHWHCVDLEQGPRDPDCTCNAGCWREAAERARVAGGTERPGTGGRQRGTLRRRRGRACGDTELSRRQTYETGLMRGTEMGMVEPGGKEPAQCLCRPPPLILPGQG